MKRSLDSGTATTFGDDDRLKKIKLAGGGEEEEGKSESKSAEFRGSGFADLDDNLLYEIFKHADARSLAVAACVSKIWSRTARDERLWELICTRHWPQVGCGTRQFRSVVLTLGGFRRLHSLYIWPLTKTPASSSLPLPPNLTTAALAIKPAPQRSSARWGKEEVNVSLSLLSIRYFEKMSFTADGK